MDMSLNKLRDIVAGAAWCAAVHGVSKNRTRLSHRTTKILYCYLNICYKKRKKIHKAGGVLQVPDVFMALAVGMVPQVCLQALHVVDVKYLQVLIGQSYFNKETFLKATRFIQTLHKRRNIPYSVSCVMYYILYICGQ